MENGWERPGDAQTEAGTFLHHPDESCRGPVVRFSKSVCQYFRDKIRRIPWHESLEGQMSQEGWEAPQNVHQIVQSHTGLLCPSEEEGRRLRRSVGGMAALCRVAVLRSLEQRGGKGEYETAP